MKKGRLALKSWGCHFLVIWFFVATQVGAESMKKIVQRVQAVDANQELVQKLAEVTFPNGHRATTGLFRHTTWELKDPPQSAAASGQLEQRALQLTEEERLQTMHRFQDHMQLWWVSLEAHPGAGEELLRFIKPGPFPNQYHRELAWLGRGHGYSWYGHMPIYQWIILRKQLGLEEGNDTVAAAARGLEIEDRGSMTANSVAGWLVQAGSKALPFLSNTVKTPHYQRALRVLARIQDPEAGRMLITYCRSPHQELAKGARHYLIQYARPEAEALYFQWLDTDAGRVPVGKLLQTCAEINQQRLKPFLTRILASPQSRFEFREAFELTRDISNQKIPRKLLEAEVAIMKHGYRSGQSFDEAKVQEAAAVLFSARDVEAAAHIAISLACARTKGDWSAANEAGIQILNQLPGNQGRILARTLASSCPDELTRQQLSKVSLP